MMKLRNLIKYATIKITETGKRFHRAFVAFGGKDNVPVQLLFPYGFYSRPVNGSQVTTFNVEGHEDSKVGIADDPIKRTLKDIAEGEVVMNHYTSGSYIHFKQNGDVVIHCVGNIRTLCDGTLDMESGGDMTLKAPNIHLNP